ncbi:hypothetical protein EVAR_5781_1 [Eumeta japonica]|uniref:Uncharacterized protein n=1 Tax=Eumeta variegata TaxID=151549 RepID=A0A4C1T4L4_EUMVA|nr:hypothetical protein EVAR_5781_1 [Eumeta japonica]
MVFPPVPSVRAVLVAVHRVRPAAGVRLRAAHAERGRHRHPHPEPGAAELGGQPAHLLHVFAAHLHQLKTCPSLPLAVVRSRHPARAHSALSIRLHCAFGRVAFYAHATYTLCRFVLESHEEQQHIPTSRRLEAHPDPGPDEYRKRMTLQGPRRTPPAPLVHRRPGFRRHALAVSDLRPFTHKLVNNTFDSAFSGSNTLYNLLLSFSHGRYHNAGEDGRLQARCALGQHGGLRSSLLGLGGSGYGSAVA